MIKISVIALLLLSACGPLPTPPHPPGARCWDVVRWRGNPPMPEIEIVCTKRPVA